jgi:type I restriction enzyme S subunit
MSSDNRELLKLKEFAELVNQPYQPSSAENLNYIGLEHIEQLTLRLNGIGNSTDVISQKHRFKAGDILFGKLRPYFRKVVRPSFDGVCSTDIWVVRAKPGFDQSFLFYFLASKSFIDACNSSSSGTRMPRADWNNLSETFWELPSLPEQKRIAENLSALDDKIELNRQTNATLEAIAQAIFKEWFVDFNYPGATGEMVESELGPIPKGWKVGKLGEVCEFIKGVSYSSEELQPSENALVTLKSINRGGGFNSSGFKEFNGKYKSSQCLVEGDLIFAQTDITQNADVIGSPAIVENPFEYKILIASLDIVKCIPTHEMPSSRTLFHFLQRREFKDYCLSQTNGSTVLHLRTSEIPNYELIIPDTITFQKFDLMVTAIRESVLTNNKQNRTLEAVRDKLLPKLINGEIEV